MKRFTWPVLMACVLFTTACHFSAGYQKNILSNGLSFKYSGFDVKSVILVDSAGKIMEDNKVGLNSQVSVVALGMGHFELKEGKAFPGMMLSVTDKAGLALIDEADLFAGGGGYPPANTAQLRGDITVAQPMRTGETYHVKIHIWDKVKPSNTVDAEVDLVVR